MTTDDERRDVAGRLRDSIPADLHLGRGNKAWGLLYLTLFGRYMPNQASGRTYKQVAELLADLIEPEPERTCRDTSPLVYKFTCSECHSSYRFGCEHGVWYCPFCGAKVVGND